MVRNDILEKESVGFGDNPGKWDEKEGKDNTTFCV